MSTDAFWELIDRSRGFDGQDRWQQHVRLEKMLLSLPPEEIISFRRHFSDYFFEAFRWDLWAVAYIVAGGCSDDGFMDFRSWLISQGREFFEECLKSPEHVSKGANDTMFYEQVKYAPSRAYRKKMEREIPSTQANRSSEPIGIRWDESDLEYLYPALWNKYRK